MISSSSRASFDRELRRSIPHADQRRDRGLDRRQRRAEVVRQRVEQRRLQLLVAPRGFGFARAIEGRLQFLIQPFDLALPRLRFGGAPLRPRRQLARDDRRDDEA